MFIWNPAPVNSKGFTLQMDTLEELAVHEYFFLSRDYVHRAFLSNSQPIFVLSIKHDFSIYTLLFKKLTMKILVACKCHLQVQLPVRYTECKAL